MPSLELYCTPDDLAQLLEILGDELAFIIPDGDKRWRAVATHTPPDQTRTALWHIPSGPLPLLGANYTKPNGIPDVRPKGVISDPFDGWTEQRTGADPNIPYFGAGHPGIFWLNLRLSGPEPSVGNGLTTIEWIGNHYASIGNAAPKVTSSRWARLRRQIAKVAQKVPYGGLQSAGRPTIWAFPHALQNLQNH